MEILIGSFVIMGLSCLGLGVGYLMGRPPLKGTCGSLAGLTRTCPRGLSCGGHCRRFSPEEKQGD